METTKKPTQPSVLFDESCITKPLNGTYHLRLEQKNGTSILSVTDQPGTAIQQLIRPISQLAQEILKHSLMEHFTDRAKQLLNKKIWLAPRWITQ